MKAEIRKEYSIATDRFTWCIYIDDKFQMLEDSLEKAKLTLERIKLAIAKGSPAEVVHMEVF